MNTKPRVVLASGNRHKVQELRALLTAAGVGEVEGLEELGHAPRIEETATDFVGNAQLKAEGIARWLRERDEPGSTWVIADDSGLCVDALEGRPGVRSARFAGPEADDGANNRKLQAALRESGCSDSRGHYACALVLMRVDGGPLVVGDPGTSGVFEATWPVTVRVDPRGTEGFGYDPHAWLGPEGPTVAELSPAEKSACSHRAQALGQLLAWVRTHAVHTNP